MSDTNKDIQDLRKQQYKRNSVVSSFALIGALSGFLIARSYKTKIWVKITSTILGATILGLPVFLITRKKYQERKKSIKEKLDINIKVSGGKINIKPNTLTASNQAKVQTIISNIEKANEQVFTKQERPKIEEYFTNLSDEDITTWVRLSQSLNDKKIATLPNNEKQKYLKDKYNLDINESSELLMRYMDFLVAFPKVDNTKQA